MRTVSTVNMLLVDVRCFLGGDGSIDEFDCRQMLFGPNGLPNEQVMWNPTSNQPIRGIWDAKNKDDCATAARERIDVVGFVHEEVFVDDEIRQVARLFRNPVSSVDLANNPVGWPPPADQNIGLRTQNALWNLG